MSKVLLSIVVIISSLFFSSICSAEIEPSRCAIGGIRIGSTKEHVQSIYGKPTSVQHYYWIYGKSFTIGFNEHSNTCLEIFCNGNNGLATPDGVKVGMDASILHKVYGTEDLAAKDYYSNDDVKVYYSPGTDQHEMLVFWVKDGKIKTMGCFYRYRHVPWGK